MISAEHKAFLREAEVKTRDLRHRAIIQKAVSTFDANVATGKRQFVDWEDARTQASLIKWEALNHLDRYLQQFEANCRKRGGHVFWAETGEQCRDYILDL